jgi:hypothetical protein
VCVCVCVCVSVCVRALVRACAFAWCVCARVRARACGQRAHFVSRVGMRKLDHLIHWHFDVDGLLDHDGPLDYLGLYRLILHGHLGHYWLILHGHLGLHLCMQTAASTYWLIMMHWCIHNSLSRGLILHGFLLHRTRGRQQEPAAQLGRADNAEEGRPTLSPTVNCTGDSVSKVLDPRKGDGDFITVGESLGEEKRSPTLCTELPTPLYCICVICVPHAAPRVLPESLFVYSCFYPAREGPFRAGYENARPPPPTHTPPPHTGFPMSAHLSRLRLFQRHLRSLGWVWVLVWDWLHSHTPPRTRSPSSRHPPFTHYPFPLRSLVCGGQPSPHKPRLVVSHSTCPPLSSSPHSHSFVLGTAVINTHTPPPRVLLPHACTQDGWFLQPKRRPARLPRRTVPSNCICRCSRMRARLPLPRVLLPHTCTQDGWFLQPKHRPARLPRKTVPSNCVCRCSRIRARLPLHILLLHTQVCQ